MVLCRKTHRHGPFFDRILSANGQQISQFLQVLNESDQNYYEKQRFIYFKG